MSGVLFDTLAYESHVFYSYHVTARHFHLFIFYSRKFNYFGKSIHWDSGYVTHKESIETKKVWVMNKCILFSIFYFLLRSLLCFQQHITPFCIASTTLTLYYQELFYHREVSLFCSRFGLKIRNNIPLSDLKHMIR